MDVLIRSVVLGIEIPSTGCVQLMCVNTRVCILMAEGSERSDANIP